MTHIRGYVTHKPRDWGPCGQGGRDGRSSWDPRTRPLEVHSTAARRTRIAQEIRATGTRLAAAIDDVDQRLGKKIDEADERLDAKMDAGFGMVARQFVETEERLKHHTDMRFEMLREDIGKVAEGVVAVSERLDRDLQQNEAERTRLDRAILAGAAALDRRVTALEKRAPG